MIDSILHYSLFNTGRERMTASSNSFHVKEEAAFGCKTKKKPRTPRRHDQKEILFQIYFLVFVFLCTLVDLSPLLTFFFSKIYS